MKNFLENLFNVFNPSLNKQNQGKNVENIKHPKVKFQYQKSNNTNIVSIIFAFIVFYVVAPLFHFVPEKFKRNLNLNFIQKNSPVAINNQRLIDKRPFRFKFDREVGLGMLTTKAGSKRLNLNSRDSFFTGVSDFKLTTKNLPRVPFPTQSYVEATYNMSSKISMPSYSDSSWKGFGKKSSKSFGQKSIGTSVRGNIRTQANNDLSAPQAPLKLIAETALGPLSLYTPGEHQSCFIGIADSEGVAYSRAIVTVMTDRVFDLHEQNTGRRNLFQNMGGLVHTVNHYRPYRADGEDASNLLDEAMYSKIQERFDRLRARGEVIEVDGVFYSGRDLERGVLEGYLAHLKNCGWDITPYSNTQRSHNWSRYDRDYIPSELKVFCPNQETYIPRFGLFSEIDDPASGIEKGQCLIDPNESSMELPPRLHLDFTRLSKILGIPVDRDLLNRSTGASLIERNASDIDPMYQIDGEIKLNLFCASVSPIGQGPLFRQQLEDLATTPQEKSAQCHAKAQWMVRLKKNTQSEALDAENVLFSVERLKQHGQISAASVDSSEFILSRDRNLPVILNDLDQKHQDFLREADFWSKQG